MADEKVILEALASSGFKVSIHDKKRTEALEIETAEETKKQFGEDLDSAASDAKKDEDSKSLLSVFKQLSESQRETVVETLKHNGLGDPLTKEKVVQNAFTVEKTIRANVSN